MSRTIRIFSIDDPTLFKQKMFVWAQQFETAIWLDSNNYEQQYSSFNCALAMEEFTSIKTDFQGAFEQLKEYQSYTKDYIFGYISYDVKNDIEKLTSSNFDGLNFPDLYFFQPQKLIFIKEDKVEFHYLQMIDDELEEDFEDIIETNPNLTSNGKGAFSQENDIKIKLRIHKDEYHQKVEKVLEHIHRGDIYEANFCQEFYAENTVINPYEVYVHLNKISEPPFATFFRNDSHYLLSATPERYIRKEDSKIISQPIKGTAKRLIDPIEDEKIAFDLARDEKERSENIMIVDLVRNDLSKTAKRGSVQVEELCKVYPFKQVHQMISTVVSEIKNTTHPVDVIKDTFPMGSMTGAPKISAMKIIETLEETKRGLYSGTVGYFTPEGDFDFNVVIRSILYNAENKYVSYSVGGAITSKSTPEKEYEECLLKAKAMKYVLTHTNKS
ncbi:anthranilate synthase component I family protein [Tenacibaculum caenipelagi]|uniref:Para-aminobenzoate synthetase component 1 n=1 Tax=Tenacibaculum caenipelagi TaxID=1325435 RepID=A0A4R6TF03_9FLAO|nr:anthranilate synthase component I family protein [Tenacibaculum caenipelagi]TDQ22682.1 para-aminobenzoate synthetase component 1 [Tenacibaculum caenipelagi]